MEGGSGFLRTAMEPGHLESQLERDLRAVPYIVGVNGHMGSRFTSDPRAMRTLLAGLRERGLFFLDSKTSPESVAADVAAGLQVPFAERDVFLDHDPEPAAVGARARDGSVSGATGGTRDRDRSPARVDARRARDLASGGGTSGLRDRAGIATRPLTQVAEKGPSASLLGRSLVRHSSAMPPRSLPHASHLTLFEQPARGCLVREVERSLRSRSTISSSANDP